MRSFNCRGGTSDLISGQHLGVNLGFSTTFLFKQPVLCITDSLTKTSSNYASNALQSSSTRVRQAIYVCYELKHISVQQEITMSCSPTACYVNYPFKQNTERKRVFLLAKNKHPVVSAAIKHGRQKCQIRQLPMILTLNSQFCNSYRFQSQCQNLSSLLTVLSFFISLEEFCTVWHIYTLLPTVRVLDTENKYFVINFRHALKTKDCLLQYNCNLEFEFLHLFLIRDLIVTYSYTINGTRCRLFMRVSSFIYFGGA